MRITICFRGLRSAPRSRARLPLNGLCGLGLAVTLLAAGCGGSGDGGVTTYTDPEFVRATIEVVPGSYYDTWIDDHEFRATRVWSEGRYPERIQISAVREPNQESIGFDLQFGPDGQHGLGTFRLASFKQAHVNADGPGGLSGCVSAFNSTITITRNDAARIEGTFEIELDCGSVLAPAYYARNGAFSICVAQSCEDKGWRNAD